MEYIFSIGYNLLLLPAFYISAKILFLFKQKIRSGFKGRKELAKHLRAKISQLDKSKDNILVHCSSLGEFEQAKPIIDELDKTDKFNLIVSFFSPSGFNHSKFDHSLQSKVIKTYIPFDSKSSMKEFVGIINPKAAIVIKYDLWLNFLNQLKSNGCRLILANAAINGDRLKNKFFLYRQFKKLLYSKFDLICCTDISEKENFAKIIGSDENIFVAGDTKYERIENALRQNQNKTNIIEDFVKDKFVFVVGSSWNEDEDVLFPAMDKISFNGVLNNKKLLSIVAPHEPTEENIEELEFKLSSNFPNLKAIRFSELNKYKDESLIVVDSVGLLMNLYKYASIAFVGGGFRTGLHNVLEPAGNSIPVLFGNNKISDDAKRLVLFGGGIPVKDAESLYQIMSKLISDEKLRTETGEHASYLFKEKSEASKKIIQKMFELIQEKN